MDRREPRGHIAGVPSRDACHSAKVRGLNYYRRFMADYGAKTAALSLAEHGAYNLLLDICYSTEKPLPASYDALYRLCRAMNKAEQDAVKSVADSFFPVGEDGLRHNQRADEEITKAQSTIAKQRESGVESAARRWSTDGSTHKSTDPAAIQPPTSNPQKEKEYTSPSAPFLAFWQAWPANDRKASKGKCFDIWRQKKLDSQALVIAAHVEAMKGSQSWREGYIPAPITYLRQQRWDGAETAPVASSERRAVM